MIRNYSLSLFGSTFGACKIESRGLELMLTCLVVSSKIGFASIIHSELKLEFVTFALDLSLN